MGGALPETGILLAIALGLFGVAVCGFCNLPPDHPLPYKKVTLALIKMEYTGVISSLIIDEAGRYFYWPCSSSLFILRLCIN